MSEASVSIYQQALGAQWDNLSPVVRQHYDLKTGESLEVVGVLHRVYHAALLTPLLQVTGRFGLLFPEQGENVRTTLVNKAGIGTHGKAFVSWRRCLYFKQRDGSERLRRFDSIVTLLPRRNETLVLETIALNQAVALRLTVDDDGTLVYQSAGFYTVLGSALIPAPAPTTLSIREWAHPTEPDCFRMAFTMTVPLMGTVFGYGGEFRLVG